MPSIKILPDNLINKIAAGEVVERPASVVKELIENALDAGANEILVDVEQAGKRLIRITDNGAGMAREDALLAFERHATSKISSEADLEAIRTMGFRGEALSSIAAVSQVRMLTARRGGTGTLAEIDGGKIKKIADAPASPGTSIEVNHLFFNTPARLKFLKSQATEFAHIADAVSHQAMAHPSVRFKLIHNKKTVLDLLTTASLRERAQQVLGSEMTENLIDLSVQREPVVLSGLIGKPNYNRGDRTCQEFYVNGRFVRNPSLSHALYQAYADLLMRDRHPAGVLFLELDPALVDVNVHPAKTEVRFRNQSQIHDLVRDAVREALRSGGRSAPHDTAQYPFSAVQEAVAGYLLSQGEVPGRHQDAVHPHSYGRRRTDQSAAALPHEHAAEQLMPEQMPSFLGEVLVPLAQVHDSFIVAQSGSGMALIDQHAAHERILFENLQEQQTGGIVPAQNLLIPAQVEVGPAEQELLKESIPELERLGLVIEEFGGGTVNIRAVPALLIRADPRQLLNDILDEIRVHGTSGRMDVLRNEVLSVMACHPAIKVHRRLTLREMEDLIRDLYACRMPHSCPHGRPTIVRFTMDEIKKMFKRI